MQKLHMTEACQSSACPDGYVLDCDGSRECHPASWIGDNYADCEDQIWGAILGYDNDGGDCGDVAPDGLGCTDPTALNFDSEAIEDDSLLTQLIVVALQPCQLT